MVESIQLDPDTCNGTSKADVERVILQSGLQFRYQMFEYAIGHWLQKATEHVLGCVLCSPGCFSLFRGKAVMDDNVMRTYTTVSTEPR